LILKKAISQFFSSKVSFESSKSPIFNDHETCLNICGLVKIMSTIYVVYTRKTDILEEIHVVF